MAMKPVTEDNNFQPLQLERGACRIAPVWRETADFPLIAGPCQLLVFSAGTAMGSVKWKHVPRSRPAATHSFP